jgi:hypothetical protein
MNTMRDQHECYQHHREGKCAADEIGVVLAGWLAGRFSRARHMTSFAPQETIPGIRDKHSRRSPAISRRLTSQTRRRRGKAAAACIVVRATCEFQVAIR